MDGVLKQFAENLERDAALANDPYAGSIVILHPGEERKNYTDEELECVNGQRSVDFSSRIYITALNVKNNTTILRTRFSDNAEHASYLNYVRDYFKAANSTKHYTSAKAALTQLLTMFFNMSNTHYYNSACTMASALSDHGEKTLFEIDPAMVEHAKDIPAARQRLVYLMDIVFSKVSIKRYLIDEEGYNIYRLVHCITKREKKKKVFSKTLLYPLGYCIFSFLLQMCLLAYVIFENISIDKVELDFTDLATYKMVPLALLSTIFSIILASPEWKQAGVVYEFYGGSVFSFLWAVDFFVNVVIPLIVVFAGFILIALAESYIDAVLNTTALLFISEIDDLLPGVLEMNYVSIVQDYLVDEALDQFDTRCDLTDGEVERKIKTGNEKVPPINFCDLFLTNTKESGACFEDGILFQPFEVTEDDKGTQLAHKNVVTKGCILTEIEWCYTTLFPNTTKPRISYLRLVKLDGSEFEIVQRTVDPKTNKVTATTVPVGPTHCVSGVFVITNFQMSDSVLHLRVCGSNTPEDFLKAFDYYSLWELAPNLDSDLIRKYHSKTRTTAVASKQSSRQAQNYQVPDFQRNESAGEA